MRTLLALFLVLACLPFPASAQTDDKDWAFTLYGVVMTDETLFETLVPPTDMDSDYQLLVAALSRRLGNWGDHIQFEAEVQFGQHFGLQHHQEFNALIIGRWLDFPWDHYLDTSMAIGEGISYANEIPVFEALNHDRTSEWLDYLMFEVDVRVPDHPDWSVVGRLHHRSGIYGTFHGVHGASNSLGLGVKYRF